MSSYLKWVGGKGKLAPDLINLFPQHINRYFEPFVGSGAMFFSYFRYSEQKDMFDEQTYASVAILNDFNSHLINCHEQVASSIDDMIPILERLEDSHRKDPQAFYHKIRESVTKSDRDKLQSAAEFIYINKTCFNGIWRVNKSGGFNVPWNKKKDINLASTHIQRCSKLLKQYAEFVNTDFETFIKSCEFSEGDFVFLDPPYIPVSATSNFVSYTEDGWDYKCDLRLKGCLEYLDNQGVKFMMTNSDADLVYDLFGKWNIGTIRAHRFVKALKGEGTRTKVDETVTTNY